MKLSLMKKKVYPAGVDLNNGYLKIAQLGINGKGLYLHAGALEAKPEELEFGTAAWQKWAVATTREMISRGGFSGKGVIASIPSEDIFIEQIKVASSTELEQAVFSKIKSKLPFDSAGAMVNYVVTGSSADGKETDVLVMAAARDTVNRQLAIYEKAGLEIKGISVWPLAMANSFAKFFARRQTDKDVAAMLLDIDVNHTKIVISKQDDLLFARLIPIGFRQLALPEMVDKLISETDACSRYFENTVKDAAVQRLVFFSGKSVDEVVCEKVSKLAQRMQVPAQLADVMSAVEVRSGCDIFVDRRGCQVDWSIAFGLSLSNEN